MGSPEANQLWMNYRKKYKTAQGQVARVWGMQYLISKLRKLVMLFTVPSP